LEAISKQIDLEQWESLFRHEHFGKVEEVLSQRIECVRNSVHNRAKICMNMDNAIESAGDLRVAAELEKILLLFKSLRVQIMQNKGAK
jgi:hypothetical protein